MANEWDRRRGETEAEHTARLHRMDDEYALQQRMDRAEGEISPWNIESMIDEAGSIDELKAAMKLLLRRTMSPEEREELDAPGLSAR